MKPLLSVLVLLLLFQSFFLGLVKLELTDGSSETWDVTLIHKSVVLDPFLLPGKEGIDQNFQNKNEWIPFHFNKTFTLRNTFDYPVVSEIRINHGIKNNFKTLPVFIINGTLRI